MFKSTGIIKYEIDPKVGYKCVLEIDEEIARYYRQFVPKSVSLIRQGYRAHISIVRKVVPPKLELWGAYDQELAEFWYDGNIEHCEKYYWMDAYCQRAEEIRETLGLEIYHSPKTPTKLTVGLGIRQRFHITLGNYKL